MLGFMDAYNPDADDWSAYIERLDLFFLAVEIKDDKKVAVVLTVLGIKAYTVCCNIQLAGRCHEVLCRTQTNSYCQN